MNNKPIYVLSVVFAITFLVLGGLGFALAEGAGGRVQEMVLGLIFWVAIVPWGGVILLVLITGLERAIKGKMTGLAFSGLAALNLLPFLALFGIFLLLVHRR